MGRACLCERGSMMLESLLATTVLTLVITGGLALMYLCYVRVWIDRTAYEAAICLASSSNIGADRMVPTTFPCEQAARAAVSAALPIGKIKSLLLQRSSSQAQAQARLVFEIEGLPALERIETLQLPLKTSSRGSRVRDSFPFGRGAP
jgi:hypothetical protein